ncbi:MAG: ribonuclease PH [Clostridiales bacterium]|nr:ribonuclease PH [Clostridiales bacterium]
MQRIDQRSADQLRPCSIQTDFVGTADGSCLIACGGTRIIVTASVDNSVPPFLRGRGQGWLTAEYAMLPASTRRRKARDGIKRDSRGVEISRLIGRSLRQAIDLSRLGERTITIDCDVLEADGGTRTAAITGGFVALCLAIDRLIKQGHLKESPIKSQVAAVSCGLVGGTALLDLCYVEDSQALADMNFVMNEDLGLIEVQGTGEGAAFPVSALVELLELAQKGVRELMGIQRDALGERAGLISQKQTLILASANQHKIEELRHMLGCRFKVIGMREAGFMEEIEETGQTFADNAIKKAEAVCNATGYLSLADDSGLEVLTLDGAPGVTSARFAGKHGDDQANNRRLLELMEQLDERAARFVSVLALASPFAPTQVFTGICEGVITREPRGEGGFGYDPLFEIESGQTFAQLSEEEKNKISHRANAMKLLLEALT